VLRRRNSGADRPAGVLHIGVTLVTLKLHATAATQVLLLLYGWLCCIDDTACQAGGHQCQPHLQLVHVLHTGGATGVPQLTCAPAQLVSKQSGN